MLTVLIIASVLITLFASLFGAWKIVSKDWRSGDKAMPSFLFDMGIYQGKSFRYFDGITINGVDIGGMSKNEAAKAVVDAQNQKKSDLMRQKKAISFRAVKLFFLWIAIRRLTMPKISV